MQLVLYVEYSQTLLLKEKNCKIAPFILNPRAPVQVIHRSGAPVMSLLSFRDGFIASQGGSRGQLREVILYSSTKHWFKFLVCGRARLVVLHDSLAYCTFYIVFNTLLVIVSAPSNLSSLRVMTALYSSCYPQHLVQCPLCSRCSINIVRVNVLALIANHWEFNNESVTVSALKELTVSKTDRQTCGHVIEYHLISTAAEDYMGTWGTANSSGRNAAGMSSWTGWCVIQ